MRTKEKIVLATSLIFIITVTLFLIYQLAKPLYVGEFQIEYVKYASSTQNMTVKINVVEAMPKNYTVGGVTIRNHYYALTPLWYDKGENITFLIENVTDFERGKRFFVYLKVQELSTHSYVATIKLEAKSVKLVD